MTLAWVALAVVSHVFVGWLAYVWGSIVTLRECTAQIDRILDEEET